MEIVMEFHKKQWVEPHQFQKFFKSVDANNDYII